MMPTVHQMSQRDWLEPICGRRQYTSIFSLKSAMNIKMKLMVKCTTNYAMHYDCYCHCKPYHSKLVWKTWSVGLLYQTLSDIL